MPIDKKWSHFTKEQVGKEDNKFGCYELSDTNKNVHYIGEGLVKNQLLSHLRVETPLARGQSFTELNIQVVKTKPFKDKMLYLETTKRNMVSFQSLIKRVAVDL